MILCTFKVTSRFFRGDYFRSPICNTRKEKDIKFRTFGRSDRLSSYFTLDISKNSVIIYLSPVDGCEGVPPNFAIEPGSTVIVEPIELIV